MVYTSCFTSCRTTEDFKTEIRKDQENLKTLELQPSAQSPPNPKFLYTSRKLPKKIEIKVFPYFTISQENYSPPNISPPGL